MADVLAEAVVELEADIDKFNKDFTKSLKQAEKDAKASTDDIDKSFKRLSGDLGKDFEQATREVARQFREQEREAKRVEREIEREAKRVARELEREARDVRRAWERELRLIARENARVQREIEAEIKRTQRAIEAENKRVALENAKAQAQYEKEFIASQHAMEKATQESQKRQAEYFKNFFSTVRKFASERFSLTLGVDTSQITRALGTASKLGAVLGGLGVGALAGQASLAGLAQITLAIQDLVGAIALLPAVGASAGVVMGTLALGLRGLGDAISADKPEELAEALEKLSDNGKKFVTTVRSFKDEFEDLSKSVQQALLTDFNKEVERLAKALLPSLKTGFVGVATELNLSARSLAEFVRQGQTVQDIQRVFDNTQISLGVFRRSLTPLAQAFRDLIAVGSDFLPVIAADIGGAAKSFGDFIRQARDSGQLAEIFGRAIQSVRDFLAIIGNIGSIINSVLNVAEQALGGGFLAALRNITQSVEDFVESFRGQTALFNFFQGAGEAARLILPIIGDLARLILEVVLPAFTKLGTVAAPGLSALVDGLRRGLEKAIPGIISFVDSLSSIVVSLVDAGVLDALGDLVRVLGTTLGAALRHLAPTLGDLINSILLKLTEILPKIIPALGKFADAFANLVIAALPVVDVLADIISNVGLPTLQRIAEQLTPLIGDLAQSLNEVLLPVLPELTDAFEEWVDAMAPLVDDVLTIFVDLLKILVPLLPSIVRSGVQIATAFAPLIQLFADFVKPISEFVTKLYEIPAVRKFMEEQLPAILALITGGLIIPLGKFIELIDKVVTKLDNVGIFDAFIAALGVLGNVLSFTGDAFKTFGAVVDTTFSIISEIARFSVDFVASLITNGFGVIQNIFSVVWETNKSIFSSAWEFIKSVGATAMQFILSIFTSGFNALPSIVQGALIRLREAAGDAINRLLDIIRDIPNRIVTAIGNLGSLLYGAGQDLIRGMVNGIISVASSIGQAAGDAARGALRAARDAILAKSPSRAMMAVGEDFGQGFIVGINDMVQKAMQAGKEIAGQTVQASMTALAPTDNSVYRMNESLNRLTRNGLGPTLTSNAASSASGAPSEVVVTPEVHVYIGNEEITSHITDVVDERNRRTKRSLTMGAGRLV
jgi:phage-related protein